jgi:alpha-tubulin suppressor-like RCC1 family protein
MRRTFLVVPVVACFAAVLGLPNCASPTALTISVYSDIGCMSKPVAGVIVGTSTEDLRRRALASTSLDCTPDGRMGSVVVYPSSGPKDGQVAVQVVARVDGSDPSLCTEETGYKGCIVARRELRLDPNRNLQMRIDLRTSCIDKPCDQTTTCVRGACVTAKVTCESNCSEQDIPGAPAVNPEALPDSGSADASTINVDASAPDAGGLDAGGPAPIVAVHQRIAGGFEHTCALTTAGAVKCWGDNGAGQLGLPASGLKLSPTLSVPLGAGSATISITAGNYFSCALSAEGAVKCWGWNNNGRLGDGSTASSSTPVDVALPPIAAISSGANHTCAVTRTGSVKCWGFNNLGQLGNNTTIDSSVPVDVVGLASGVVSVSGGYDHSCAILTTGAIKCWGNNGFGALGNGNAVNSPVPVDVVGFGPDNLRAAVLGLATYSSCVLTTDGSVKCWGWNMYGGLGDGTRVDSAVPLNVIGLGSRATLMTAGRFQTCVQTVGVAADAAAVKCWGWNRDGDLGNGTQIDSAVPVTVLGLQPSLTALGAGLHYSCALTATGSPKCWGWNEYGMIGDNTRISRLTPVDVLGF